MTTVVPIGVIRNPKSQRNRTRPLATPVPLAPQPLPCGVTLAMPATPQELAETLSQFAALGIQHLLIDGGDGTLRDVLGALPAAYGTNWPTLALCASGNTNLAAMDVGSFAHGPEAIAQFHAAVAGKARYSTRRTIAVRWPDGSRPPVFSFFVGCANYARGVQMATGALRKRGFFHSWAIAATIAAAAWQVLTGAKDSDWQRGSALTLAVDDAAAVTAPRFIVLATSLEKLMLGLWPFWSEADADGSLHWLDIRAPAPRFGRALPALLRGQPKPWMHASAAYHSGRAERLLLTLAEPLIIDGEAYLPDSHGQLELRAGPEVHFFAPV